MSSLLNEHLTRQADIIPSSILSTKITVIGAGAIGSFTTLALAKMGFTDITIYDDDLVDTVNMNAQFYRFSDINSKKVYALRTLVADFTNVTITCHDTKYAGGILPGIVISAVDSMAARRLIWREHAGKSLFTTAIIDPRMGAETASLYVMKPMNPHDQNVYINSLYKDSDAVQEKCTAKATVYTVCLISGLVVKAVKDILTRPDYLRTAQYNIAENDALLFCQKT